MVFQSKDGVTSDIDGWLGRSFASAAVKAAIGSAGSGGGMAEGVPEECIEATEGNNPSEKCHVACFNGHNFVMAGPILVKFGHNTPGMV